MKESITKFDLEAAFKALDEIDIPKAGKVKANRPALTEIFSRKTKFDALMEEYYDISSNAELEDAQEAREAEVAQAKLARIEKIVDLDADSPEDLLTSYVGKYIMQCPQCMTLFYKDKEDIVEAEDDPDTVNVNEVCQHCGNESGYTLVGKVGEAEADEMNNFTTEPELEVTDEEIPEEPSEETEEAPEEDLSDLEDLDLDLDFEDEEEKKEESFNAHGGEALVEELSDDPELDDKLEAQDEYIEYLRVAINAEKEKLEKEANEQIKATIQRNIDALEGDLSAAVPDAIKNDVALPEEPSEEVEAEAEAEVTPIEEPIEEPTEEPIEEEPTEEPVEEALDVNEADVLLEGSGADAKAAANAIANELAKDDKKKWAQTTADVIKVIPDEFADQLFDAIKQKASNIKLNAAQKNKIVNSSKSKITHNDVENCDTVGQILALFDGFEWAKTNPGLVKGLLMVILAIVALVEPTPVVEIITLVIGLLPEEVVAKVVAILGAATPAGFAGTAAHKIYQKYLASKQTKTEDLNEVNKNTLTEAVDLDVSADEFKELINSPEFKKPISDAEVRALINDEKEQEDAEKNEGFDAVMNGLEDLQELELESLIANSLVEAYSNVAGFRLTECAYADEKFTVDGTIYFTSGNTRKTTYSFTESRKNPEGRIALCGLNEKLGLEKQFILEGRIENKTLITESFKCNK